MTVGPLPGSHTTGRPGPPPVPPPSPTEPPESAESAESLVGRLNAIVTAAGCADCCTTVEVRRDPGPVADLRLFLAERRGSTPGQIDALAGALEADPAIASIRTARAAGRSTVSIRLADEWVEACGEAIVRSGPPVSPVGCQALGTALPAGEPRWLVGFLGANSSKGLHLGHLRNILVGHATVSLLAGAGLPATAYSLVGDIGRNVCEALAGYQLGLAGPGAADRKPDIVVGASYRAYLARAAATAPPATGVTPADPDADDADDPCEREYEVTGDEADELLARWWSGDPDTRAQWRDLVARVDQGHRTTLGRLDVGIDQWWPESADVARALDLVDLALDRGVARRLDDGRVVFDSDCPGFPTVVLTRSDGFPTEHARVVAVFHRLFTEQIDPVIHLDYNGTEWEHAQRALSELMQALKLIPPHVVHRPSIHGMVLVDGAALSSSQDEPPLVDDLLEALVASPEIAAVVGPDDPAGTGRLAAADIVLKTFFLAPALAKPLVYSWERLLDPAGNAGWAVAGAWCCQKGGGHDRDHDPTDRDYRLAVLQAESLPLEVAKSIGPAGDVDLSHLTRFLALSAGRLLDAPLRTTRAQITRATLQRCLGLLGYRSSIP